MRILFILLLIALLGSAQGGRIGGPHKKAEYSEGLRVDSPEAQIRCDAGFCLTANEACMLLGELDSPVNFLTDYNETYNTIGCAERCEQDTSCSVWTWYGDSNLCQTFLTCPPEFRYHGCSDCQTGERSCGLWESNEVVVSGGLGPQDPQPNQPVVTIVGPDSIINSTLTLPRSRWGHVSAYIGYNYYTCGGSTELDGLIAPNDTCDVYDAATRLWEHGVPLREARHGAAAVELFGRLFVLGGIGIEGLYLNSIEVFEPNTRSWNSELTMWTGLAGHCAIAVQDGIFLVGGSISGEVVSGVTAFYNITSNQWTKFNSMNTARSYHGCSAHLRPNGHNVPELEVMVTGGMGRLDDEIGEIYPLNSVEIFNLRTKSWRSFTPLPEPRAYHSQANNRVTRLFGGVVAQNITDEILELQPGGWVVSDIRLKSATRSASSTLFPTDLVR